MSIEIIISILFISYNIYYNIIIIFDQWSNLKIFKNL